MSFDSVDVLGVRFDNVTRAEAARAIVALARSGEKHYVVKPYSEFMTRAARNAELRQILNSADLRLADGVGILWAAHYLSLEGGPFRALLQLPMSLASLALKPDALRRPLKENMAGVDLTCAMLAEMVKSSVSAFFLGGTEDELTGTLLQVRRRLPGLRIAGAHNGHFHTIGRENEAVIAEINRASPDVLLVGMGFPRQERWIANYLAELNVRIAVAEGGSFSFISGRTRRAPAWMRRVGLEWLFRLLRQPWRLRRQLALPVFVWLVAKERLKRSRP